MSRSVLYASSPLLASKTPVWRSKFIVAAIALAFAGLAGRAAYIQVFGNAFFQRGKYQRAVFFFQPAHVCLRKVLIFSPEFFRHVHIIDLRGLAHCGKNCVRKAVPALRLASTHVENAVDVRILKYPEHKFHAVLYIDKITHLPAICIVWAV